MTGDMADPCIPYIAKKPFLLEIRSSTWFIIAAVSTAIFTDIFLYAVIVPVFPFSLVNRIGVSEDDVQHWLSVLLSVYGAGLLVVAPICGYLSDRIANRRTPLLIGMIVIAGATIMLCLARSLPLLIIGRLLQGAAAAVIWVVGMALLADTVGAKNAGQVMGYVGAAYSLAALLAPLLGGIVYEKAGYYSVFGMAFGMIVLDLVLRLLLIEKKVACRWLPEPDLEKTEIRSPVSPVSPISPVSPAEKESAVSIVTGRFDQPARRSSFEALEALSVNVKKNLPPIVILLKSRRMQTTFAGNTVLAMVVTAFDTTLPLFVKETFHWNSIGGGLIFLAFLSPAFFNPVYGHFVDKHGPRWIAFTGLLVTVPFWALLRLVDHSSMGQKIMFCVFLCLLGLGVALALTAIMAEFAYICAVKEQKSPGSMGKGGAYAQSYGIFNVSWALGNIIGAFWSGGVRQAAGWGTMTWSFALLCGLTAVPVLLFTGGWIGDRKKESTAASV